MSIRKTHTEREIHELLAIDYDEVWRISIGGIFNNVFPCLLDVRKRSQSSSSKEEEERRFRENR